MERSPRIGLFDSGIGGMSVLAACLKLCPSAAYFYYGDNARAPYGSRPAAEITAFTREALAELKHCGIDAAILACNTATAVCVEEMRREFSFPVVGVEPAVASAAKVCRRVLVLATPRTAESGRLRRLIARFPKTSFTVCAVPGLAAAIEAQFSGGAPVDLSAHLPCGEGFDGAVLGCTHYSLIKREIAHYLGAAVFDGAFGTARHALSLVNLGIGDHFKPPNIPNNCLSSKLNKNGCEGVFFLGSGQKHNRDLFDLNICFNFI